MSRSAPNPTSHPRRVARWLAALAAVVAAVPTVLVATASPAAAAATITVSKTTGLSMDGESLTVTGSGMNPQYGAYVVFCRDVGASIPDQSTDCATGGAAFFSLPTGSFSTTIQAIPKWDGVDCTVEVCGVRTMNDHRSFNENSEHDSFTPVTFDVPVENPTTSTEPETPTPTSTTTTTPGGGAAGPATTNKTRITLSKSADLAGGEIITVSGTGFVADQGIYVRTCAAPLGTLGTAEGRADECYPDQDGNHTVWITPVPADGSWTTPLTVADAFGDVDCRTQSCGVFVRRDHSGGATDFSQDAFVPVTFGDPSTTPTTQPGPVGARLTVTPATGIISGSTVTVEGAGFRAGHEIFVGICDTAVANFAACDFETVEQVTVEHGGAARAVGPGTFVAQLVARSKFGATDCSSAASRCAVATWAVSGNDAALEVAATIEFASASSSPVPGTPGGSASGAPLARTGSESTQLALIGTLAILVGAGLFAAGRRRMV